MKTNKSVTKRIRVTKNGKLISRKPGQNHFNAKEGGRSQMARNRSVSYEMSNRLRRRYLPNS